MRNPKSIVVALATLAACLAAPGPSGTNGALAADAPNSPVTLPGSTTIHQDAVAVAEMLGVSVAEADLRLTNQDLFDVVQEELAAKYPTFVDGWTEHGDEARYFVRFAGSVPPEATTVAARLHFDVTGVEGRWNSGEINERLSAIGSGLREQGERDYAYGYSVAEDRISIEVASERTASAIRSRLPEIARDAGITLATVEGPLVRTEADPATTYGGAYTKSGGGWYCTTAFAMKDTSLNTDGFLTAGHCHLADRYVDPDTGALYTAVLVRRYFGEWGDFAYYRVNNNTSRPYFHVSPTTRRDLTSIMGEFAADPGDTLCVYGRKTNQQKCAIVKNGTYSCGTELNNMVRMDRDVTQVGDSGAPWFIDNKGAGVHSGDCQGTSWFSKLAHANTALTSRFKLLLNN